MYFFPEHIHSLTYSQGLHRALLHELLGPPACKDYSSLVLCLTIPAISAALIFDFHLLNSSESSCCALTLALCSAVGKLFPDTELGQLRGLSCELPLLSGIPVLCWLVVNARKLLSSIFCQVLCLFCLNGGRHTSYQQLHHILKWNSVN